MFFRFLPKNFNFFDLLEKQAAYAVEAAQVFREIALKGTLEDELHEKVKLIEHQGDDAAHAIYENLNKTFITPFDREDIHRLTKELDDVIDMVNTIVNRLKVYNLDKFNKNLTVFAAMIHESTRAVERAVQGMRDMKNSKIVSEACVEVNRLENEGDMMKDAALIELFEKEKDPIMIIKWKDIYQDAETILDVCEDVAHVVETIVVKQA